MMSEVFLLIRTGIKIKIDWQLAICKLSSDHNHNDGGLISVSPQEFCADPKIKFKFDINIYELFISPIYTLAYISKNY